MNDIIDITIYTTPMRRLVCTSDPGITKHLGVPTYQNTKYGGHYYDYSTELISTIDKFVNSQRGFVRYFHKSNPNLDKPEWRLANHIVEGKPNAA
jgi:hypothetical protein